MSKCFVGIDTSNYTTSVGIVDADGNIVANIKKLLPVAAGECGLRQSDAVFAHIKNLPEVLAAAEEAMVGREVSAIGYSEKPRNIAGSYMPCFLCGKNTALAFRLGRGIPAYAFSHQCGHVAAALTSADAWGLSAKPFVAFHVSGGTTEVVLCSRSKNGFETEIIGGTRDLSAGQAIDRAGVMMQMQFPCGPELERAAADFTGKLQKSKISVRDGYCNLSGLENLSAKVYAETGDVARTSAYVLRFIGATLVQMAKDTREKYGDLPILFAGGVMSNKMIREMLQSLGNVYFAAPALSADNAVGIAELARRVYLQTF